MVRPTDRRPITRSGLRRYLEDNDIRRDLLDGKGEVRGVVSSLFKNYSDWFARAIEPQWQKRGILFEKGPIAGDFRATISIEGIRLGVVGVNSAFLHFEKGLKLAVELPQQGDDAPAWLNRRDANLLLMHHPVDWLDERIQTEFLEMCYPPHRYVACFLGHMHAARVQKLMGNGVRRFFQAASLFGLEQYGGAAESRVCGYSMGSLEREGAGFRLIVKARRYDGGKFVNDSEGTFTGQARMNEPQPGARVLVLAGSERVMELQRAVARELEGTPGVAVVSLGDSADEALPDVGATAIRVAIIGDAWPAERQWTSVVEDPTTILLLAPGYDQHEEGRRVHRRLGNSSLILDESEARTSARAQVVARLRSPGVTSTVSMKGEVSSILKIGEDPSILQEREEARTLFDHGDFGAALTAFKAIQAKATSAGDSVGLQRARLNIAASLLSLNRVNEATVELAAIDVANVQGELRSRYATLLAYCGQTVRARDLLVGDVSQEADRARQVIDLREGKIPVDVDPDLRLEVARVLVSRGSLWEAARIALELIDDSPS